MMNGFVTLAAMSALRSKTRPASARMAASSKGRERAAYGRSPSTRYSITAARSAQSGSGGSCAKNALSSSETPGRSRVSSPGMPGVDEARVSDATRSG